MRSIKPNVVTHNFNGHQYVTVEDYVAALPSDEWLRVEKNDPAIKVASVIMERYGDDRALRIAKHILTELETW